jgi:hypothetical protein
VPQEEFASQVAVKVFLMTMPQKKRWNLSVSSVRMLLTTVFYEIVLWPYSL